jgi:hypothetical protein
MSIIALVIFVPVVHKRMGTKVMGERVTYRQIAELPFADLGPLIQRAVEAHNSTAASWVAEVAMLPQNRRGGVEMLESLLRWAVGEKSTLTILMAFELSSRHPIPSSAWTILGESLDWDDESFATAVLEALIEQGDDPPDIFFVDEDDDLRRSALVGGIYLKNAESLVGEKGKKDDLIKNKTTALRILGNARENVREKRAGADSGLYLDIDTGYSTAMYLMWNESATAGGSE